MRGGSSVRGGSTRGFGAGWQAVERPRPLPESEDLRRLQKRWPEDWHAFCEYALHNKQRDDQSFFLVHFTKSDPPCVQTDGSEAIRLLVAHERFEQVLRENQLYDCPLPHLGRSDVRAVCFTEMTPPSLSAHAENYSPWGFAFHKSFLFNAHNANPVHYCRDELLAKVLQTARENPRLMGPDELRYYTPFRPKYGDGLGAANPQYDTVDSTHEREWRTPGPASFSWSNLAFVYVPSIPLFKQLLPDLYRDLCEAEVEIKAIQPIIERGRCNYGYSCWEGCLCACECEHTKDQAALFQWYRRNGWLDEMSQTFRRPPPEPEPEMQ